ncbi:transposable element Tcb2 transposase [Trichonephila clavipes]|nr:transposable element Tcb2 transposase [Trichonephila clavipes]
MKNGLFVRDGPITQAITEVTGKYNDQGKAVDIIPNGALTSRRYKDEIIGPIIVPYFAVIGDDFMLMDENCRPHNPNLVDDFFFEKETVHIELAERFPHINSMELVLTF